MKERTITTYMTTPNQEKHLRDGFRPVKEYECYWLYEKVVGDKVLYRECFHKFDLFGADWCRERGVIR